MDWSGCTTRASRSSPMDMNMHRDFHCFYSMFGTYASWLTRRPCLERNRATRRGTRTKHDRWDTAPAVPRAPSIAPPQISSMAKKEPGNASLVTCHLSTWQSERSMHLLLLRVPLYVLYCTTGSKSSHIIHIYLHYA